MKNKSVKSVVSVVDLCRKGQNRHTQKSCGGASASDAHSVAVREQ